MGSYSREGQHLIDLLKEIETPQDLTTCEIMPLYTCIQHEEGMRLIATCQEKDVMIATQKMFVLE